MTFHYFFEKVEKLKRRIHTYEGPDVCLYGKFQPYLQFSVSRIIGRDPSKKERAQTDQLISPCLNYCKFSLPKEHSCQHFNITGRRKVHTRRIYDEQTREAVIRIE